MENKENLCTLGEDVDLLSIPREAPEQNNRNRKSGRSNLRKSLAWNQAFSTEEGVLDSSELFVLTRSSTKSDETSPKMGRHKSASKRARNISEQKSCCKMDVQSEIKDMGGGCNTLCKLNFSTQEKHQEIMDGDPLSDKQTISNIPKPTAAYSQKRVAHTSSLNTASKLPKFMSKRSSVSSVPIAARDVLLSSKHFKLNSSDTKVQQVLGQRESSSCLKETSDITPLKSKHYRPKDVQIENGLASCKGTSGALPANLVLETSISSASIKGGLSTQKADHVSKGAAVIPPAPVHAKPSALRMPSPSLGFFNQGKLPCGSQPRRNIQLSLSNAPITESIARNHTELSPATVPAAPKYCPQSVICESRKNSDATNSALGASSVTFPSMKKNVSMSQPDMISAGQPTKSHCLSAYNCVDRKPQAYAGRSIPNTSNAETHEGRCKLQVNTGYLVEETKQMVKPLESNLSKDVQTNCLPIMNICENRKASSDYPSNSCLLVDTHDSAIYEHEEPCSPKDLNKHPSPEEKRSSKHSAMPRRIKELDGEGSLSSDKESDLSIMDGNSISSQLLETSFALSEEHTTETLDTEIPESPRLVKFPCASSEDSKSNVWACKVQLNDNNITKPTEDADLVLDNKNNEKLERNPMKLCLNATPFSDEWLAAMEAFGEEILARKTGAVQNSPQEKKHPEPSPWSPVKKVQEVGPYDCTKYSRNIEDEDS